MAIQMAGAVYCPLSPRDPQHRLYSLLHLTQSRAVLIHNPTRHKFSDGIRFLDIDVEICHFCLNIDFSLIDLSKIMVVPKSISYTIFTSGSTGKPKPVIFQQNFFI